ncbi:ATP-binding cassette transporter [Apiosordaria backusii]|uniref:ATP-binding cassette transporter n=1 Tax=Apiosordaria backusii TaxID=314023 RepID=A0AA39ZY53_9PEZI|nr:ATP-binding cassette transporter [Apiosordaria backusii]
MTSTEGQPDSIPETMERRQSHVQELAREFSRTSFDLHHADDEPIFGSHLNNPNSPLNPVSDKFNARAWASNLARAINDQGQSFRQIGICFENLSVFGYGTPTDYQKDVANIWTAVPSMVRGMLSRTAGKSRIDILRDFNGLLRPGEMCAVLGPPGSGCSTLLKTLSGDTNGLHVSDSSYLNYQGITANEMRSAHRGDAIYTAEADVHFPHLTVEETLSFASRARCQRELPLRLPRDKYAEHFRDVVMAMYGISHTRDTKVGDNFIRGVSGGERKRVTIAEATLSNAPFQCWDNSTRGLDAANALEFCKTLRLQSELFGQACALSLYQTPQSAYDLFDKTTVLYEGRQIYFGPASKAKEYFINLGFDCPARQTTPDFLTSMTCPEERITRPGCNPPRTAEEFTKAWKESKQYQELVLEMDSFKQQHPLHGEAPAADTFRQLKKAHQSRGQRVKSPYILSYQQQVALCMWRGWRRFRRDPAPQLGVTGGNVVMGLIMSSLYYNMGQTTADFYGRSVVLFMAILFNAFASVLELLTLYEQRPIVEKQARYAFYHPSAEYLAGALVDLPLKVITAISFNLVFYFMTNLNRQPGNFFFYLLVVFLTIMTMSGLFRFIGSLSRTEAQAMVPASILLLALLVFAGFIVPIDYMLPWCRWINHLDPIAYAYEALMINEFAGRTFPCATRIPDYATSSLQHVACDAIGAIPGLGYVKGEDHIASAYRYFPSHKWRNVGVLVAMAVVNHVAHFITSEYVTAKRSKGEVLVYRKGVAPRKSPRHVENDIELASFVNPTMTTVQRGGSSAKAEGLQGSTSVFHWSNVCYDIKIKGKTRRLLDHVDGWVKPGTLTALMGVSGAGKTTLLDCLADRRGGIGVLTGEMLVDGKTRDESFQRKTGYAQQQDLHLDTGTVREALTFSALLRQPATTPVAEKLAYVEKVIRLLDMEEYADAVIGVIGEGLNVEQRKRLTIGVELAAKPPLLLFVDEPTSGLDSQTSWAVLDLLEKLSRAGQSILCTIHQPSAMLFQRFDRLLLLAEGGKTVYFGDIGENSRTLTHYFEANGAASCLPGANPAEWVLEAIGAAPGSVSKADWPQIWRSSSEYVAVKDELDRLRTQTQAGNEAEDPASFNEFAIPLWSQYLIVQKRIFQASWRTPSYIYSKLGLVAITTLFIGMVFLDAPLTQQGLQNQTFAIFEMIAITGQLVTQQMPNFVTQRSLYEVRERPAKTYSWVIFMITQLVAEIPWYTLCSVIMWALFYFPIGFFRHAAAAGQQTERGVLMWLLTWQFLLWVSTFAHMCIAAAETAADGGNIANFLFTFAFFFCGVLATPSQMPGFWVFVYRASPLSYWVSSILSTGLANVGVYCAENEFVTFEPPSGQSCGEYMAEYISRSGGYLLDEAQRGECSYCPISETNVFLAAISSDYGDRWRNFGIIWVYIFFNVGAACVLYWLARMPKGKSKV